VHLALLLQLGQDHPVVAGSTTTVTYSAFLAAERIIEGPPMSMFSITSSKGRPFATASRNG